MHYRTFIGLDVHARSVKAGLLDGETGEIAVRSAPARTEALVEWVLASPGPAAVAYEAGPTGYGLARALDEVGVACLVAAPSRIARAPGDRVKTDRRDAVRLARLLRLGELVAVRIPSRAEEAARDLMRAREDARSDLMCARHRLSKLLLRQGFVWEGSTCGSTGARRPSTRAASAPRWQPRPWRASWPAGAGAWPRWSPEADTTSEALGRARQTGARSIRDCAMSRPRGRRSILDQR
jgi:hypothetical protein